MGGVGNKGPGSQGRSWEKGQDQERGEVEGKECRREKGRVCARGLHEPFLLSNKSFLVTKKRGKKKAESVG